MPNWSVLLGAVGLIGVAIAPTLGLAAVAGAVVAAGSGSFLPVNWAILGEGIPDGTDAQHYALSNISTAGATAPTGLFSPVTDAIAIVIPGGSSTVTFAIGAGVSLITLWSLRSSGKYASDGHTVARDGESGGLTPLSLVITPGD